MGFALRRTMTLGAVCWVLACAHPAQVVATAPVWSDMRLDQAIAQAGKTKQRVFVKFEASWCGPCRRLGALLHEPEGSALLKGMIAVRVDFDDPKNRAFVERYVVLGLPTVVVLDSSGEQTGRVMGYEKREEWLAQARAALASSDPLPTLRAAKLKEPGSAAASLALGKALLVRGKLKEGLAELERTGWLASRSRKDAEIAAEALFVLGRFHHRVKQDPAVAQHVWRELAMRFASSSWAGGAWWWYARAQQELGRPDVGVASLVARIAAEPGNASAVDELGSFVMKYRLKPFAKASTDAIDSFSAANKPENQRATKLSALRTKLVALAATP